MRAKLTQPRPQQKGVTLLIAMVLLLAMSLFGLWSAKSSNTNLRIASNQQARTEALDAAQLAVERTLSKAAFTQAPEAIAQQLIDIDTDGDQTVDHVVRLNPAPTCYRVKVVKVKDLDPAKDMDLACLGSGSAQNTGLEVEADAGTNGDSLCADSEWRIRAEIDASSVTDARVAIQQGVKVRTLASDADNACP